jgi:glycosyltransferase involved in cell wall biosynthesis
VLVIPRHCPPDEKNWEKLRKTFGWWPTKFAEYIATGRPVIVTTLDEPSDFVEKYDCGFTCAPTPEALSTSILTAKESSPHELRKKGISGRKLAEKEFDVKVIGEKYYNFLMRILNGS